MKKKPNFFLRFSEKNGRLEILPEQKCQRYIVTQTLQSCCPLDSYCVDFFSECNILSQCSMTLFQDVHYIRLSQKSHDFVVVSNWYFGCSRYA